MSRNAHRFFAALSFFPRQSDVVKKMREAMKNQDDGIVFEPTKVTMARWLDVWLEEYVKPSNKPLSYITYKSR